MRRDNESRGSYAARLERMEEMFNESTTSQHKEQSSNSPQTTTSGCGYPLGVRVISPDEDLIWD